jgi:hypothetical protein
MTAAPVAVQIVEVGSIVRFEAPGSRNTDGQPRVIPAVVLGQWPDGSLQLYALHFEGHFLVNAIPVDRVELVLARGELDRIEEMRRRDMTDLENRVVAMAEELERLRATVVEGIKQVRIARGETSA